MQCSGLSRVSDVTPSLVQCGGLVQNLCHVILQIDGDWRYDSRHSQLVWSIDLIDGSNRNGAAEFVVPATDPGTFFPVEVSFSAPKTLCDIQVRNPLVQRNFEAGFLKRVAQLRFSRVIMLNLDRARYGQLCKEPMAWASLRGIEVEWFCGMLI